VRVFEDLRRMPRWEAAVLILSATATVTWWIGNTWTSRPGRIDLNVLPADAVILIDNVEMGVGSMALTEHPGPYTLSIKRDGYTRDDRNIEVAPGSTTALNVTLEPSPDTGFELTSDPPGILTWLDGEPIRESSGAQARSVFCASRIAPGRHVLELRDERFKTWRQDVEIEPGAIRKIHATLVPLRRDEWPIPNIPDLRFERRVR
jgi:hypothetical protein